MRSRAVWRACLAGGGALLILLGIALGIPDSGASGGHPRTDRIASAATHGHKHHRRTVGPGHKGTVTTTAGATTGSAPSIGSPLPVGSSDGVSQGSAQTPPTTLPTAQSLGVGASPPTQSVPITTTAALLLVIIGCGAFGAGWAMGRRRALPPA